MFSHFLRKKKLAKMIIKSSRHFTVFVLTISLLSEVIYAKPHARKKHVRKDKVFLLVLDGIVHNYDELSCNLPNFAKFARRGVRAKRMIPVFPTNTFPNMETLNTGLYVESHGIVNNHVFDESAKRFVNLNNVKESAALYKSEPIWSANQKQGRGKNYRQANISCCLGRFSKKPTQTMGFERNNAFQIYLFEDKEERVVLRSMPGIAQENSPFLFISLASSSY